MKNNPISDSVLGGLVWLVIFGVIYFVAKLFGWEH
jgi:hypothetical protein